MFLTVQRSVAIFEIFTSNHSDSYKAKVCFHEQKITYLIGQYWRWCVLMLLIDIFILEEDVEIWRAE